MRVVKASMGCLLMLLGLISGGIAFAGLTVFGVGLRDAWCLPGIFSSILGGLLMGYGLVRRKKVRVPPAAGRRVSA